MERGERMASNLRESGKDSKCDLREIAFWLRFQ